MKYKTEKKAALLAFLKENSSRAFTVDQIVSALSPSGDGRSTYYRIISDMVKESKVKRIADDHTRHTTYQYLGDGHCTEHLHLKCKSCGRLIHLDCEASHRIETEILALGSFSIDEGSMLFGRCAECKGGAV